MIKTIYQIKFKSQLVSLSLCSVSGLKFESICEHTPKNAEYALHSKLNHLAHLGNENYSVGISIKFTFDFCPNFTNHLISSLRRVSKINAVFFHKSSLNAAQCRTRSLYWCFFVFANSCHWRSAVCVR